MSDLLVKLYTLPDVTPLLDSLASRGIRIRAPLSFEKHLLLSYVRRHFDAGWASECDVAFGHHPASCYMATQEGEILGFSCFDCTQKNFFGPTGVSESARGKGIGKALLLSCLHAMARNGYAYAVIGASSADEFYRRTVGAVVIEGSDPGIYADALKVTT